MTEKQKQIRADWVANLRSGKYPQGTHFLRTVDDNYCCLGVLCELAVKEGVIDEPRLLERGYFYGPDFESSTHLPLAVRLWAGMTSQSGKFSGTSLANINDLGRSFEDIASIIEKEDSLFVEGE